MKRSVPKLVSTSVGWPKPEREGLLHAALGDYAEAIPAWEDFLREEGADRLDDRALRLLPQVYRNLVRHEYLGPAGGTTGPTMEFLREIANEVQGRSEALLEEIRPVIRHLNQANIQTMLLQGRACDLLVPANDLGRALDLLTRQGWRSEAGLPKGLTPTQQRYRHAMELASPTGLMLNLHWHVLHQSRGPRADEGFWKRAWPAGPGMDRCLRLSPTDQLLDICAQGFEDRIDTANDKTGHWVCEAMMTIRAVRIDWELLLKLARQHDIMLPLGDALRYLRESFHAPVPRSVIWRLRRARVSRVKYGRRVGRSPLERLIATYRDYRRGVRDWPWLRRLLGFPAYLAFSFRLAGPGRITGN